MLQRAAVVGRVFWSGALEHLAPDLEVERPARGSAAARVRPPRAAFLDLRGVRVSLQAHAHPRGRVRGPREAVTRPAARAVRGVDQGAHRRGAAGDPCAPSRPGCDAPHRARRRSPRRPDQCGG